MRHVQSERRQQGVHAIEQATLALSFLVLELAEAAVTHLRCPGVLSLCSITLCTMRHRSTVLPISTSDSINIFLDTITFTMPRQHHSSLGYSVSRENTSPLTTNTHRWLVRGKVPYDSLTMVCLRRPKSLQKLKASSNKRTESPLPPKLLTAADVVLFGPSDHRGHTDNHFSDASATHDYTDEKV